MLSCEYIKKRRGRSCLCVSCGSVCTPHVTPKNVECMEFILHIPEMLEYSQILFFLILRNHTPVTYHKFSFLAVSWLCI